MELIFLKLGGSLITHKDKPFTENKEIIKRIAKEIHQSRRLRNFKLLIGNGGGSYAHTPAKMYRIDKGLIYKNSLQGLAEVQDAASRLNRIIVRNLLAVKEKAISFPPSSICITKNSRIIEFYLKPLEIILEKNAVPIIYGDAVLDIEKGCSILSTEELFVFLAKKLKPKKIISAGIVNGVFTKDPLKNKKASLIKEISFDNYSHIKKFLSGGAGIDVTGGMAHKVKKYLELTKLGINSYIISGIIAGEIRRALLGQKIQGTLIKKNIK